MYTRKRVPIWKINNGGLNGEKQTVDEDTAARWTAAGINYLVCVCLRVYRVAAAASMFIDTVRTVRGSRGSSEGDEKGWR